MDGEFRRRERADTHVPVDQHAETCVTEDLLCACACAQRWWLMNLTRRSFKSSRHRLDDDEIEVGCHGAKSPGNSGQNRRKLFAAALCVAGVYLRARVSICF